MPLPGGNYPGNAAPKTGSVVPETRTSVPVLSSAGSVSDYSRSPFTGFTKNQLNNTIKPNSVYAAVNTHCGASQ